MTTVQSYGEGDSHANNLEQSAQNLDSTVNPASQMATTDTAAATSAESSISQLDPLPDDPAEMRADAPAEPIKFSLPFFLRWQVRNYEQTCKLLGAIDDIFMEFRRSKRSKELDDDRNVNQSLAYSLLESSITDIIHAAAAQRIEGYKKPKSKDIFGDLTLPILATNDPELDTAPVLVDSPSLCNDISVLQDWVVQLQKMLRLQAKVNSNLEEINALQKEVNTEQSGSITNLKRQVEILDEGIARYQVRAEKADESATVATAHSYVDLPLYLSGGAESDAELLREVLAAASQTTLKDVLSKIVLDETDEAFWLQERYDQLQKIMARLGLAVTEVASNNYDRYHYTTNPEGHIRIAKNKRSEQMDRKADYIDKYSVFTLGEEEPDAIAEQAPDTATNQPPANETTPTEGATE